MKRTSVIGMVLVGLVLTMVAWGQQSRPGTNSAQVAPPSVDQNQKATRVVAMPRQAADDAEPESGPLADISFPGGTVKDYIALVKKTFPGTNIIVDDGAGRVPVPAMELTQLREYDAVGLLNTLQASSGGDALQVLRSNKYTSISARLNSTMETFERTSTWSLVSLIQSGVKLDDILTAIKTALEVAPGEVTLRFHDATGVLVARGVPSQLEVVDDVLERLQPAGWRNSLDKWNQEKLAMQVKVAELEAQVQTLSQRVDKLEAAAAKPQ